MYIIWNVNIQALYKAQLVIGMKRRENDNGELDEDGKVVEKLWQNYLARSTDMFYMLTWLFVRVKERQVTILNSSTLLK